ncbi:Uncharacterised protein [Mycobacteroides abscessus subsp. abscessus]|nr:Uncharacterised protein [Mycobacteroides abscessus subsp. abscessus]
MASGEHDRRTACIPTGETGRAHGVSTERRYVEEVPRTTNEVLLGLRLTGGVLAGHLDFDVLELRIELLDTVGLLRNTEVECVVDAAEPADLGGQFALVIREVFGHCILHGRFGLHIDNRLVRSNGGACKECTAQTERRSGGQSKRTLHELLLHTFRLSSMGSC